MHRELEIVIPIFCEVEGIESFHRSLQEVLRRNSLIERTRVLYVIDPCDDATTDVLMRVAQEAASTSTLLLIMGRRYGHQACLLTGLRETDADAVITMDGDLQHPPGLIPQMLEAKGNGYDIVQMLRVSTEKQSSTSRFFSSAFYRLLSVVANKKLKPGSSDFRLYTRPVIDEICRAHSSGVLFLRSFVQSLGFRTLEMPYRAPARQVGKSKFGLIRKVSLASEGFVSTTTRPLIAALMTAIAGSIALMLYCLAVIILVVMGRDVPSGWMSLVFIIGLGFNLVLWFLAILSLYVVDILNKVAREAPTRVAHRVYFGSTNDV